MKRKIMRLVSLLCAAALVAGTFAGCGPEEESAKAEASVSIEDESTPLAAEEDADKTEEKKSADKKSDEKKSDEKKADEKKSDDSKNDAVENKTAKTSKKSDSSGKKDKKVNENALANANENASFNENASNGNGVPSVPSTPAKVTMPGKEYTLVWSDEFEGDKLNEADWNYELHEPGWVNKEWQAYVKSDENIMLKDGALVIKPVKTVDADGNASYTSGRVNTQGKRDFTYGWFECRAKVPEGMGYLPAFWMMPTDENLYGQWPRCGEIDIMEVMGQDTKKAHGTVHFGNPHDQRQGTKTLKTGDFHNQYHTFAVDWEPGKITWYIDGIKYYETSDWYSTTVGQGTISYPAPFDQPFYMILNLAVGGEWVGYPDASTDFDNQAFTIDYVRVYQRKDGYSEEGVTKPEKEAANLRNPDATGNFIINGDFKKADKLDGSSNYQFMTALGGVGTASIVDAPKFGANAKAVKIESTNGGTVDYSVQFVQPSLPMEQSYKYKVSFDAYTDGSGRTMKTSVTAPDHNYIRYLNDTLVNLTGDVQHFEYEFEMTEETDANGRLEFNLGNCGSTDTVYITNIRVEKGEAFVIDTTKKPLTDGNYIYNGCFQEGTGRMGDWEVSDAGKKAAYKVTDLADGRRFEISTRGCADASEVKLVQKDIPASTNNNYAFSFDVKLLEGDNVNLGVKLLGQDLSFNVTKETSTVLAYVATGEILSDKSIEFMLGCNAKLSIDNVRLVEDSLIKNGSFNAGLSGYEVYAYTQSDVTYTVDSLQEDNAFDITIQNTGSQDWHIQLKQNGVRLEQGQWYRLQFDAKSSLDRTIMYALQRDGSKHNDDWTPYLQSTVDVNGTYSHVDAVFQMTEPTDAETVLSISMGAVGGKQISDQHRVCLDNFTLEKVDNPNGNMLKNADFSDGMNNWSETIANWNSDYVTDASSSIANGAITYVINNPGTDVWHVQLKQEGLNIEKDKAYKFSFDVTTTVDRTIMAGVQGNEARSYAGYSGDNTFAIEAGKTNTITKEFTMGEASDDSAVFYFSLGKTADNTPASTIVISNIKLLRADGTAADDTDNKDDDNSADKTDTEVVTGQNMLKNPAFASGIENWTETIANWNSDYVTDAVRTISDGTITYVINNPGTDSWHVQLKQNGLMLENGATYKITFDANASVARTIMYGCQADAPSYEFYAGNDTLALTAGDNHVEYEFVFDKNTDNNSVFYISMGKLAGIDIPASTIALKNISLVKVADANNGQTPVDPQPTDPQPTDPQPTDPQPTEATNLIQNADFAAGLEGWKETIANWGGEFIADAYSTIANGIITYTINHPGTADWNVQLMQQKLRLEQGKSYDFTFTVVSNVSRTIKAQLMSEDNSKWYNGADIALEANVETPVTIHLDMSEETDDTATASISMGKLGDFDTPNTISIKDIKLIKKN